jgi:hypothetical protein
MIEEGMGGRVNKHPYTTQLSAYYLASRPKSFLYSLTARKGPWKFLNMLYNLFNGEPSYCSNNYIENVLRKNAPEKLTLCVWITL